MKGETMNKFLFLGGLLIIGAITSFGIYKKVNSVDYLKKQVVDTVCTKEKGVDAFGCECTIIYIEEYLSEDDYKKLLKHCLNNERVKAGKIFDTLSFREMFELGSRIDMCIDILKKSRTKGE